METTIQGNRVASERILTLKPNEIFVFGSNEAGIHGAGAARFAMTLGAVWGQAYGLQGQTFAIPTKDKTVRRALSLSAIQAYVDRYISFCRTRPDLTFLTTEIGCGLAGLLPADIAPMFKDAVDIENICLPAQFWRRLGYVCW